jgi:hypothetical protein
MNYTECFLDLTSLFKDLESYRYFATKIKTPYFKLAQEFPEMYPVGRDVDIVTHSDDFENVIETVNSFCKVQEGIHRIIHDSDDHQRHRLESPDYFMMPNAVSTDKLRNGLPTTKLHFQIDVSTIDDYDYMGIGKSGIVEDMEHPVFKNGVKILQDGNEALMRCVFYAKSKSMHHRNFIYNFRDEINESYIIDKEIWHHVHTILL